MIKHIQKTDIVLTEHVGNPDVFGYEQGLTPEEIYERDITWAVIESNFYVKK